MEQQTRNTRERLIGANPGAFLAKEPHGGEDGEQDRARKLRQTCDVKEEGKVKRKENPLGKIS